MKGHYGMGEHIFEESRHCTDLYMRTEQQYTLDKNLKRLSKDVRRLVVHSRVKVDRLRFLTKRLLDMKVNTRAGYVVLRYMCDACADVLMQVPAKVEIWNHHK